MLGTPDHPTPSHTLLPSVIGLAACRFARRSAASIGWVAVSTWTFGSIYASSAMVIGVASSTTSPQVANDRAPRCVR